MSTRLFITGSLRRRVDRLGLRMCSKNWSWGISSVSHVFVRLDGTEVFTYLPEASNCSNAGPIRVDYVNEEQWQSFVRVAQIYR